MAELCDIADALRIEEGRWAVGLGGKWPELPTVDLSVLVATEHGPVFLPYRAPSTVDDGTWGLEDDVWDPGDDEGGEG